MIQKSSYYDSLVLSVLAEHVGSGGFSGPLYNCTLALFQNNLLLSPATLFANLTEATYSGYARQTGVTWGVPILQPNGSFQILSDLHQFIAAAASNFAENTIYGWALIDTAATPNLLLSELFGQPIPMVLPSDGFGLVLQLAEGIADPDSQGNVIR